jgi:serine/threonine-protein kinase HipA
VTYQQVDVIEVWAWGRRVGAVAEDPVMGRYVFAYAPEWIASGVELSPLQMPLRPDPYVITMWPALEPASFHELVPLLADALPDAFGNALVNAWMAENDVPVERITSLDRLAYAADRALGALEFRPPADDTTREPLAGVALADLVLAARLTVRGQLADSASAHAAIQQLIQVGSSAGGARAKAVIAFNPASYQIHSAFAPLEPGFEHWLIKLDGVSDTGMDGHDDGLGASAPYGRVEYAYYLMARAAGVEMSPCILLPEGPRRHFMTRRFDRRSDGSRLHLISLGALAHLDHRRVGVNTYDQYLQTVKALDLGPDALQQAYRRMVFNVAAVNRDDHAKNFAFLRGPDTGWSLAPAFDVTHTYRPSSPWTSRHNLRVNSKIEGITIEDLQIVGDRQDVPGHRRIVREVMAEMERWPSYAEQAELDQGVIDAVAADLERFRPE